MKKQIRLASAAMLLLCGLLNGCGEGSTAESVTKPATTTENLVTAVTVAEATTVSTAASEAPAGSNEATGLISKVEDALDSIGDKVTSLITEAGKKLDGSR